MISANLIPRPRRLKSERRRRTSAWLRFLRAYGILLAVGCSLIMLPARADTFSLDSKLARIDKRIDTASTSLTDLKKQKAALEQSASLARAISDHPDWSIVLEAIARVRENDITLESFDLSTARIEDKPAKAAGDKAPRFARDVHTIRLSGFARTPMAALMFNKRLETLAFADSVNIKESRAMPLPGTEKAPESVPIATHFDIEAVITSPPYLLPSDKEGGSK